MALLKLIRDNEVTEIPPTSDSAALVSACLCGCFKTPPGIWASISRFACITLMCLSVPYAGLVRAQTTLGPEGVEALLVSGQIQNLSADIRFAKDATVRARAATALSKLNDPRVVDILIGALTDEDSLVRTSVARALGKLKDPRAVDGLIGTLKDRTRKGDDDFARSSVADALGEIKDTRAVNVLIDVLKDENSNSLLRRSACEALGEMKDSRAFDPLLSRP